MLIPQECHKSAFQIDGPILQTAHLAVPQIVVAANKSHGTRQHEEKKHKRKRTFRLCLDDESEISEDAWEEDDFSEGFCGLLAGLSEAY